MLRASGLARFGGWNQYGYMDSVRFGASCFARIAEYTDSVDPDVPPPPKERAFRSRVPGPHARPRSHGRARVPRQLTGEVLWEQTVRQMVFDGVGEHEGSNHVCFLVSGGTARTEENRRDNITLERTCLRT